MRASVREYIVAGFSLLLVILIVVVAASALQTRKHRSDLAAMEHYSLRYSALQESETSVANTIGSVTAYIEDGDETGIASYRATALTVPESLEEIRGQVAGEGREEDAAAIGEVIAATSALFQNWDEAIALRQSGDMAGAGRALGMAMDGVGGYFLAFDLLLGAEIREASHLRSDSERASTLAFWLLGGLGAFGVALAIGAAAFISRSVLKPLSSLESAALEVAAGDLNARVAGTGPRELKHLGETLSSMMTTVRQRTEELVERNRQLTDARAQANLDALTGLRNHRAFQERIREEVSRADNSQGKVALVMLDIDDFKRVNDGRGHQVGDHVLRGLAEVITSKTRHEDTYRYGGDEFAVLLPGIDGRTAADVAERLRRAVESRTDGQDNWATVSLGVASFPEGASSAEELIYGADAAMYWAKSAGKNRVGRWDILLNRQADGTVPWYLADRAVKAPDAVTALLAALEAKDPATSAHTERCSWYALSLAQELALNETETSVTRLASLLHDVGKIAVPDDVLFKPGPLNEDEWEQMKKHPGAAQHVLSQIHAISEATPAILHHHEHFDGSGYPDGLSSNDIPIASRILLVTDAFDAMTTDRPYRKGMPVSSAIEELKRCSGSQFDPAVVDAFLRVLERHGPQPLTGGDQRDAGTAPASRQAKS